MNNFSYLYILKLIVIAFVLFLGILVIKNNKKSGTNIGFFVLTITSALWQIFYLLAFISQPQLKPLLFKIGFSFVFFTAASAYHYAAYYANLPKRKSITISCYLAAFLFLIILWSINRIILFDDLYIYTWGQYPKADSLHPLLIIFFIVVMTMLNFGLFKKYLNAKKEQNSPESVRTKYALISALFFTFAGIDFVPNYGISIYPIGFLFVGIYTSLMAYGILKHQLLDIEVIIKRTAVFAGLFAFVYGAFTFVSILGNEFFKNTLGWNQWVAMIPTVAIVTFALRPLENWLTNLTDKFLFQKKYDYRELLKVFTNEILTVLDLKELTNRTVLGLNNIIKLESAAVLLHDKAGKSYNMVASFGVKNRELSFKEEDALVSFINATQAPIQRDKKSDQMEGHSYLKEDFMALNARLCMPIVMHDQLLGILALGMKKSGEDYTQEDLDILMTLARTEGIAISNAQLFDELAKTQAEAAQSEKMAVIGTLAAGINHEICNPLGIVRGQCEMFLLNLRDGFYNTKTQEEITKIFSDIMVKVIKETDRATAITKKLSGFAKPSKRSDLEEISVDKEVEEVLGLLAHDMKLNNISLEKQIPQNLPLILADRKQIQEVLFNIIRNAAQAMDEKKQGKISIASISENGSVLIKIQDNGVGIPKDKLDAVFHPFYTTKAPGQGTGLGLFIVKQVVEKNKGNIEVESEAGVGTTFTLKFPAAQHAGIN